MPNTSASDAPVLRSATYWPWRLAAASYACLVLTLLLSLAAHESSCDPLWLQGMLNLAFSASCLLGLILLVASAVLALFSCIRRPNIIDFAVLLVTLPPVALHGWSVLL